MPECREYGNQQPNGHLCPTVDGGVQRHQADSVEVGLPNIDWVLRQRGPGRPVVENSGRTAGHPKVMVAILVRDLC